MTTASSSNSAPALDRRRHAVRPDLADRRLKGMCDSARFVDPQLFEVIAASTPLRAAPNHAAGMETEALFGEQVEVFDVTDGWAWVQLQADRYVGYTPRAALQPLSGVQATKTHAIRALGTFVYPAPDMKRPAREHLSIGARVRVVDEVDRFVRIVGPAHANSEEYWVVRRHLADLAKPARDYVDVAERLIGTPYLWGGKTRLGLDCSGLVQIALDAAGIAAPRDSDMQEADLGMPMLVPESLDGLERGDLVFWRGHVGMMIDGIMLLHANAHHMATVIEPLSEAADHIARTGSRVSSIKRLPALSNAARLSDAA